MTINPRGRAVRGRAPLRLGIAGGGTDLSPFCDDFGGAVLNVTIDRHAFAFITPRDDGRVEFEALDIGQHEDFEMEAVMLEPARLVLHQGVYRRIVRDYLGGRPIAVSIKSTVDAPAGSGLGSSSALVVALVEAFRNHLDLPMGRYEVAHLAWDIERNDLGLAGGRQDQYAAAFGGANYIEFFANDRVIVNPLRLATGALEEIEASLAICFTGQSRASHDIIVQQTNAMTGTGNLPAIEAMHQLKADAQEMKGAFVRGHVAEMARILGRSWEAKKRTASGVSNPLIEHLYEVAMQHGALSGKVSGAGGGGFMMFLVPPELRRRLIVALEAEGGHADVVGFTDTGVTSWLAT
jgi:D-glycero-alpha-D-manno-heptose-7-phosphate kinase